MRTTHLLCGLVGKYDSELNYVQQGWQHIQGVQQRRFKHKEWNTGVWIHEEWRGWSIGKQIGNGRRVVVKGARASHYCFPWTALVLPTLVTTYCIAPEILCTSLFWYCCLFVIWWFVTCLRSIVIVDHIGLCNIMFKCVGSLCGVEVSK